MSTTRRFVIPPEVVEACRRGDLIMALRLPPAPGEPTDQEELPLQSLALEKLIRWHEKYNAATWFVLNREGVRVYCEDAKTFDDFCEEIGGKRGENSFRGRALPVLGLAVPFTAVGPLWRRQTATVRH